MDPPRPAHDGYPCIHRNNRIQDPGSKVQDPGSMTVDWMQPQDKAHDT